VCLSDTASSEEGPHAVAAARLRAQSDAMFRTILADLEDAARILGSGRLRVLRDFTAPLDKSGIIAAWCLIFIGFIREM